MFYLHIAKDKINLPLTRPKPFSFKVHIGSSTWQLYNPLIVLIRKLIFYVYVLLRISTTCSCAIDRKKKKRKKKVPIRRVIVRIKTMVPVLTHLGPDRLDYRHGNIKILIPLAMQEYRGQATFILVQGPLTHQMEATLDFCLTSKNESPTKRPGITGSILQCNI